MTINIKSLNNKYLMLLFVVLLTACSHNESDGHKHGTTQEAKEEKTTGEVEEESTEATIASLTDEQIKTVGIQFGSIEQKQLTATLKANGALRVPNNNKANATSLYGGVIKTINVQVGSNVKSGQVIATITNPQFIQLQEEYLTVTSKIIYAEQELARQKELSDGNAGALKNYQSADAELKTLRTRKASLQEQIQLMGINPSSVSNSNLRSALVVKSPISGTISNVFSKIGSYVDVSSPVAEIVDNSQLHLDLNIFEKDLPLLKVGQVIHFTLTNNPVNEYDAKIYSIGTTFENDSKTIPIHCTVQGNKTGLIDGMNITAIVSLNNITTAAVPNEAIVDAEGRSFIFIITDKKPDEHHDEEEGHKHSANEKHDEEKEKQPTINFERIEVVKGISNVGYTAITTVNEIPKDAKIVTKGAFFVNAKLTNQGEAHEH
jgi:cobalt-zinc-cadmium efflux system membrane fusion protein